MAEEPILLADEFIEQLQDDCFRSKPEVFEVVVKDLVLQIKSKVKLKPYKMGKEIAKGLIEANIFQFEFYHGRSEGMFASSPGNPNVDVNRGILQDAIRDLIKFMENTIGINKPSNPFALNNFCAAVFIVLLNNGIDLQVPGRGRNVLKNDFKRFDDLCRRLINSVDFNDILADFDSKDTDVQQLKHDLAMIKLNATGRLPEITDKSKIDKFIRKKFGYKGLLEDGINKKDKSISPLLKGTSCEDVPPSSSITFILHKILG